MSGVNGYQSEPSTDEWWNLCFWEGGSYCEGGGPQYRDPSLNNHGSDLVPGQTMEGTDYVAHGGVMFYIATCLEFCWADGWPVEEDSQLKTVTPQQSQSCGDTEKDTIINEYRPGVVYSTGVSPIPSCADIQNHSSSYQYLTNFTWGELNGGFMEGNPHTGYGIIRGAAGDGLQTTRTNYGLAIYVSSGYRCPHGNNPLPDSSDTSLHMHGRAIDMYKWGGHTAPYWSEAEFNALKAAADLTMPVESFGWDRYPSTRQYHAAW